MKKYYRLNNIKVQMFVVSVDQGDTRFFLNFISFYNFKEWYDKLEDKDKTINEIVFTDKRKFILDIDDNAYIDLSLFDFERHVTSRIRDVFASLDIGNPEVIIYKMTDKDDRETKLSYHAVVSNFSFDTRTCKGLCIILSSNQVWDKCVDIGIYKNLQFIRMEGSTKFGKNSWKRACNTATFRQGLVSDLNGTTHSSFSCENTNICRIPIVHDAEYDMSQFKTGKNIKGYLPLYRVKPGYCKQCNRVHDSENAAIIYRRGTPTFMCWRAVSLFPAVLR